MTNIVMETQAVSRLGLTCLAISPVRKRVQNLHAELGKIVDDGGYNGQSVKQGCRCYHRIFCQGV